MTRTILLPVALLLAFVTVRAQGYTLTFTGAYNGQGISLDSILVMNLTQGGDTMLYHPDTALVLSATGIGAWHLSGVHGFSLRPNHPNPYSGQTHVDVMVVEAGFAHLGVVDALGREVAALGRHLSPGTHSFEVGGGTPGIQVLWLEMYGHRRAIRMVATGGASAAGVRLEHVGWEGGDLGAKDGRSLFSWTPGDALRYVGYATMPGSFVGSGWMQEVPTASAGHVLDLGPGLVCTDHPSVEDMDGHVYPAVRIGEQCWMAANLRTSRFNDGSDIPHQVADGLWGSTNSAAWCHYANDPANEVLYGKMYKGYTAAAPNLCPSGWHVPTKLEWEQLELALGMPEDEVGTETSNGDAQNVGGKLKSLELWVFPSGGDNNESGFSALPGGDRDWNGEFSSAGGTGHWWHFPEGGGTLGTAQYLVDHSPGTYWGTTNLRSGKSIRCVKD